MYAVDAITVIIGYDISTAHIPQYRQTCMNRTYTCWSKLDKKQIRGNAPEKGSCHSPLYYTENPYTTKQKGR